MSDCRAEARFKILNSFMDRHGLAGLIVSDGTDRNRSGNQYFATGSSYSAGVSVFPRGGGPDDATFVIGVEQYKYVNSAQLFLPWIRYIKAGNSHVVKVLKEFGLAAGRIGVVGLSRIPVGLRAMLQKSLPEASLVDVTLDFERLRMAKDQAGLRAMEESAKTLKASYFAFRASAVAGQSEYRVMAEVIKSGRDASADGFSFMMRENPELRMAAGPSGGCLGVPSPDKTLAPDDVTLVEIKVCRGGFWTLIGRTFLTQAAPAELKKLYASFQEVEEAGIAAARPGAKACDLYRAMAAAAKRLGVQEALLYELGAGIGLDARERPFLTADDETVLTEGMTLAVRAGGAGVTGGAVIADTIVIEKGGPRRLTAFA